MIEEYSNTNSQCNHSLFKLLNDIYLKEQQFEQDKILKIQQELEFEDNLILDSKKEEKDYIDKILIQSLEEIKEKELSEYKSKFENIHNKIDDQAVNLRLIHSNGTTKMKIPNYYTLNDICLYIKFNHKNIITKNEEKDVNDLEYLNLEKIKIVDNSKISHITTDDLDISINNLISEKNNLIIRLL